MKKENAIRALTDAGFIVLDSTEKTITISIFDDVVHQSSYDAPCAEAVVQPLLWFCSAHHLAMRRSGRLCIVSLSEPPSASEIGRKGGLARTEAKRLAAIENGKKGGRPRKNA